VEIKGMREPKDLTDQVTVFVATIGDKANFGFCIQALDGQDSRFRFDVIDHVAPMSAAFQAMIDRCETPFYVQVDEDMILDPYAIRILHDAMSKAPPTTAIVCYSLWDEHMQKAILGVKIYRHDVLRQFPYRHDVPHCDVEQNERLKTAGYTIQSCWHGYERNITCIGRHGCHYTPETAYEAYYNRAAKSRLFPQWMSWCRRLAAEFRRRVESDPKNLIDLYALLGFTAGLTTDLGRLDHEKDWRTINHDFRRVQADMETDLPSQLNLHVTNKCNLACRWCPRQSHSQKPDMQAQLLAKALEICPSIRSVCIAGFGEPLLCSHLTEIVTAAKKRNLFVGLITNGVLLADFAKVLHAWNVDSVSVSLNAATAESHKACNGSDTWGRVIAGIQEAVKLMPTKVAVSMVCHRNNVGEMPAFLDLMASLSVPTVDFLALLPSESGQDSSPIGDKQQIEIDALRTHQEAHRVRTWPMVIQPEKCPRACLSPYESISLDADGFVSPCRRVMPPSEKFGRLDGSCPPWRLPEWYKLRAALEGDQPLPEACKLCFGNTTG
jgi:MoaA/NifB/PqqE/SkfB family radical SAM enzyme